MPHKAVLIMAGGTGGHVYPALAVAGYLNDHDVGVSWLGTVNGIESRLVPASGFRLITLDISGLRGKGIRRWLLAPVKVLAAIIKALMIIKRERPDAVLGMGGFVSGPGGVAAWLLRVPLYIHEQNSIPGLTNRLLAPLATTVMEGFPKTFQSRRDVRTTGNPVRTDLLSLPEPEQRQYVKGNSRMRLLVIGGSQGARIFNTVLPATLKLLEKEMNIDIWHQTGERNYADAREKYTTIGELFQIRIDPYIDAMAEAYAWADLVLCRAGALTIAELCAVGVASILVPYPSAVDDHQTSNAKYLSEQGGAVLLPEAELQEARLAELLRGYYAARDILLHMAKSARLLARPDATGKVGDICMGVACA